jgi:hypothetical protein
MSDNKIDPEVEKVLERARHRLPMWLGGVKYIPEEQVIPHPIKVGWLRAVDAIEITFSRQQFGLQEFDHNRFVMEPELARGLENELMSVLRQRIQEL